MDARREENASFLQEASLRGAGPSIRPLDAVAGARATVGTPVVCRGDLRDEDRDAIRRLADAAVGTSEVVAPDGVGLVVCRVHHDDPVP